MFTGLLSDYSNNEKSVLYILMEIILTHKNSDFDAIASSFAACRLYPDARPVLPSNINPNVRDFLSIHKNHFSYSRSREYRPDDDLKRAIIVDTNNWSRIENAEMIRENKPEIHLWDHHPGKGDIDAGWSCIEYTGAATTLFVSEIEKQGIAVSAMEATLFLAGIYEDTGNLTFSGCTGKDARAAAYLLDHKADLDIINNFLKPYYGPSQKKILFKMLEKGKSYEINGNLISINSLEIDGHTPGLSLVVDMYKKIMNADAAFGIFTESNKKQCMLIGRSSVETVDIGNIFRNFGGGGHARAGSSLIKTGDGKLIESQLIENLKTRQPSAPKIGDIMSFPVTTVNTKTTMKDLALLLRKKGCTGFPVTDGPKVVGMISRSDFKKVRKNKLLDMPVRAFMSDRVINIDLNSSVSGAARLMVKHDIGRLPVMKDNDLVGIVTRTDTMRYYYDLLPD